MLGPARASPGPVATLSPPAGPGATAQPGTPAQAAARPQLRQLPGHQAGTPRRGQRWQRRSQGNSSCWGPHPSAAPAALPPPRFVTVRPRQPEKNSLSFCSRAFKGQDFRCLRELRYLCKKLDGVKLFPGIRGTGRAPSHLCSPPSSHGGPQPCGAAGGWTQSQHPTLWSQYPSHACMQRAQPTNLTGLCITNAIFPPFGATSHSKRQNKNSKSLSRGLPSPPLDPPRKVSVTELTWVNKLELENRYFIHRQERLIPTQS